MGSEDDLFAEQFVVEHQQSAVEKLEFVVPQDVKELRLRRRRI